MNYKKLEDIHMWRYPLEVKNTEAIEEYLERKNRQFQRLSKPKQRVQIAKDVIAQIKIGKMVPKSTYFRFHDLVDIPKKKIDMSVATAQTRCEVCGIGSVFLAVVERNDQFRLRYSVDRNEMVDYLRPWFDHQQLDTIEGYFEVWSQVEIVYPRSPIVYTRDGLERPKRERLIRIMENIISNNGVFDPRKGKYARRNAWVA